MIDAIIFYSSDDSDEKYITNSMMIVLNESWQMICCCLTSYKDRKIRIKKTILSELFLELLAFLFF